MVQYEGIKFSYKDMQNEIQQMKELADSFLADDCAGVFDHCLQNLDNIRYSSCNSLRNLEIADDWPLKTIESRGKYRASGKDVGRSVYGTLSFRWGIMNPDKGRSRQTEFHLTGEATTSIQIFDVESNELIARWQFEAGDAQSPGCHFHAAMNQYGKDGLFPEWLKVPRLPSILLTPMDGLEFLLGELFQLRWLQTVSEESYARNLWAKSQSNRLRRLLNWKLDQIQEADTTPWMALKRAKPDLGLLTG